MRGLFASFVSDHPVITAVAYVSLVFTCTRVLWHDFTELVHAIWTSTKNAIREVLDFRDELRDRRDRRRPAPG